MLIDEEEENSKESKKSQKLPQSLHLSEGNKFLHLQKYEKAIECFNLILSTDEKNLKALLGLAKSFMGLGRFNEAKKTTKIILDMFPKCTEAISLKGNIDYLQGDFETGYLDFRKGFVLRPNQSVFKLGCRSCADAINNSLYPTCSLSLDEIDAEQMNDLLKGIKKATGQKFGKKRFEPHSVDKDWKFIKELSKETTNEEIEPVCKDLMQYLEGRRKFWQMHNPDRARRPFKPKRPDWIDYAKLKELDPQTLYELASNKYLDSEKYLKEGEFDNSLKAGLEMLAILENISNYRTIETLKLKAQSFHCIGLAHMFRNDLASGLVYFERELKLGLDNEASIFKLKSLLCIGEIYLRSNEYGKALNYFKHCLDITELKSDEAIILYKIADCFMNLDQLQSAKYYAMKSLEAAVKDKDARLQLDITMLLAEISLEQKDLKAAKDSYTDALSIATNNKDSRVEDIEHLLDMFDEKMDNQNDLSNFLQVSKRIETDQNNFLNACSLASI